MLIWKVYFLRFLKVNWRESSIFADSLMISAYLSSSFYPVFFRKAVHISKWRSWPFEE